MNDLGLAEVRLFLHLLGVAGWVGGQLTMAALVPVLRRLDPDAPRIAANRFGRVAWIFFALAVSTGVWNLFEVSLSIRGTAYLATLLVKLLLVGLSGGAAAVHSNTSSVAVRGFTGALGVIAGLGALLMGVALST
ncbi:MAG TPA: hypothetical protein QF905_08520 [Acidimicrobiales bacterium]|mgnify:CR=1 FL=1|jgi:putative copper export protein|nr:hypothetical protein [Actinomycetota bacterium]MDP6061884.1 hypothetical protein [Acidimicrobiales bacterium]MDP7209696.1 hypothetical protein [Acidimicrobiales bacterium]HJL90362.1 hypothetical protein [Acidimicrobiales bacterium]HJO99653.1 hypothetical protein [Acidimicrobiales bacterium]|tara:strand:+ start:98023 stop:98427 length:405 start_codon:yes stop_codon:yes gene_type:complete